MFVSNVMQLRSMRCVQSEKPRRAKTLPPGRGDGDVSKKALPRRPHSDDEDLPVLPEMSLVRVDGVVKGSLVEGGYLEVQGASSHDSNA